MQVVDTVELFHFKRQRKLSLRFLAGYLLGAAIQKDTHDSIVDARTALGLFEVAPLSNKALSSSKKLCSARQSICPIWWLAKHYVLMHTVMSIATGSTSLFDYDRAR